MCETDIIFYIPEAKKLFKALIKHKSVANNFYIMQRLDNLYARSVKTYRIRLPVFHFSI